MKYPDEIVEKIIEALDNASYEMRYYFNKKARELTYFTDYLDEDLKKEEDEIDLRKWIKIDGIESYRKYNLIEEFASMQNERLQELLYFSLKGKGAFRRFKDVLYQFPAEQKNWYEFEYNWLKQKAIEFLENIYTE